MSDKLVDIGNCVLVDLDNIDCIEPIAPDVVPSKDGSFDYKSHSLIKLVSGNSIKSEREPVNLAEEINALKKAKQPEEPQEEDISSELGEIDFKLFMTEFIKLRKAVEASNEFSARMAMTLDDIALSVERKV